MRDKVLVQTVGRRTQQRLMVDPRVAEHLVGIGRFEYVNEAADADEATLAAGRRRKDVSRAPVTKEMGEERPQPAKQPEAPAQAPSGQLTQPESEPGDAGDQGSDDGSGDEPKEDAEDDAEAEAASDPVIELIMDATEGEEEAPVTDEDGEELPAGKRARRRPEPQRVPARRRGQ